MFVFCVVVLDGDCRAKSIVHVVSYVFTWKLCQIIKRSLQRPHWCVSVFITALELADNVLAAEGVRDTAGLAS